MAGKFIEVDEAAKMIGVSSDELIEMRSRGEIFGYRDGASWKFKQEEVQRVIDERAAGSGANLALDDDLALGDPAGSFTFDASGSTPNLAESQESLDSILITDEVVGRPDGSTKQSTIIGKQGSIGDGMDSDIQLAPEPVEGGTTAASELALASGSLPSDSVHSGSDLKLSGSGTNAMPEAAPAKEGGSDLRLGEDDDGSISLGSDKPAGGGSAIGSDITLGAGDSGINLSPTDSGLSLEEEPLDLGGSAVDSLELPEDDDVIALEDDADPDQATQLKADDQFLLSPADGLMEDESDSGSQVIALEDSESFDQDAATMLGGGEPALLTEDAFAAVPADGGFAAAPVATTTMAMPGMTGAMPQTGYVQLPVQEAQYSIWNVLGLFVTTGVLALAGMMMVDVVMNMWAYDAPSSLSSGLMDLVLSGVGLGG